MAKITNTTSMAQVLEFEVAFPTEKPLKLEEYLKGGNKSVILKAATFFLGFKSQDSKYKNNQKLLGAIFSHENKDFANEINEKIKSIERTGSKIMIVNAYTSLKLFEFFFAEENEEETQTHTEFEINLFKAYLILNSEFTKKQKFAITSTKNLDDKLKYPMMMFCIDYPISDKVHYNINQVWVTQIIKAIYLFKFLDIDAKAKPLLNAFLLHFNKPTWQDYLKSFLPLTISTFQNDEESQTDITVKSDEKFEENCTFIEKLIVQHDENLNENDFLTLRSKPIYKIEEGVYRIIFNLFLVEKIFKGVYFSLRDINETLPENQRISEFKSFYGKEFSEKILSYNVIESIYFKNCIQLTGDSLDKMKIDGAPDYYIRRGKNIFLFESKDFLIKADKKDSFDFSIYEEEFQRVLYYEVKTNGKEKKKAILQLISNIRNLLKKNFKADVDYFYRGIYIYPILLTHDHQYDTFGFNSLINDWFQYELDGLKEEGLFINQVKPLTVINIDSLIYHQAGLTEDIFLNEVIIAYHEHIAINPKLKFNSEEDAKSYFISKQIPFALFIDNYFNSKGEKKLPSMLSLVAPSLFESEAEKSDKKITSNL